MSNTGTVSSIKTSWTASPMTGKIVLVTAILLMVLAITLMIQYPGDRGHGLSLAVGAMLLMNQSVLMFLTPEQQRRVRIPQFALLAALGAYVVWTAFVQARCSVDCRSTSTPWSLLWFTLVLVALPLVIAYFLQRRKRARKL